MDCPDPLALATFYSELLGQPITYRSDDFVVVSDDDTTSGLAFQLAPGHRPPALASAERGEPWRSLFAPDDMAARLERHGFGPVRHVRQQDMIPAAAWDRTDSLRPADLSRIAHAVLPAR